MKKSLTYLLAPSLLLLGSCQEFLDEIIDKGDPKPTGIEFKD